MPAPKNANLSFDDFVRVSTSSALDVLREQQKLGTFKYLPKIWVGIIVDPWGPGQGPFGGVGGPGR